MSDVEQNCARAAGRPPAACCPGGCRLDELAPGARVTVTAVLAEGAPSVTRRLNDLGFTPGATVEVVRRAPLRDPVVYRVKDYEVCLRRAQAACVRVTDLASGVTPEAAGALR